MTDIFSAKAPKVMADLVRDFSLTTEEAAAILGNIGHECNGFKTLQEIKPVVPGSRGGWGWCQWTGPRRKDFEAWCNRKNYNPSSDVANYSFLFRELVGPEKRAIPALKKAEGLRNKVIAFESSFLRAGVKHYDSRTQWALKAMKAWTDNALPPPPDVEPIEPKEPTPAHIKVLVGALATALVALAAALGIDIKSLIP